MRRRGISIIGLTGISLGLIALLVWLRFSQVAIGDNAEQVQTELEPEPFIPSESISPDQAVAFPTDI